MSAASMLRLTNSTDIDLRLPTAAAYRDFAWQAAHLAKIKRFNGATPGIEYSVAEHQARGTLAILEETDDLRLAAYFSVHDNHEAALGDDTTPKKRAIAEEAEAQFGVLAGTVMNAFDAITERHDIAIHQAAGLEWPLSPQMRAQVKCWDLRMFVTEWRDLMLNAKHPDWERYKNISPLQTKIVPYRSWQEASDTMLVLWNRLLPSLKAQNA